MGRLQIFLFFLHFINKFCENFGGSVYFNPSPHHPQPPVHLWFDRTFKLKSQFEALANALTNGSQYEVIVPTDNCYGAPLRSNLSSEDNVVPSFSGVIGLIQNNVRNWIEQNQLNVINDSGIIWWVWSNS